MYFIDRATITVQSGSGGNGIVSFRREKYVSKGGPDGGDGGDGGNVILKANSQMSTLRDLPRKPIYNAANGENGKGKKKYGAKGKDIIIELPLGTLVIDNESKDVLADIVNPNDRFVILHGGKGGKGNVHFKSSVNRVPQKATPGKKGYQKVIDLELKIIADVGFVGFPNAGKSTLLSALSNAKPKIADYPFTTLIPNVGIHEDIDGIKISFADIPGIVENAHKGKGLGLDFLRHISRTRILLFVLDASSDNLHKDYRTLINEIKEYDRSLYNKRKLIALNKIDLVDEIPDENFQEDVIIISALKNINIDKLKERLKKILLDIIGKGGL